MAIITLLAASLLGMIPAVVAVALGIGVIQAFGLWLSVGLGAAALAGLFALIPRSIGRPAAA